MVVLIVLGKGAKSRAVSCRQLITGMQKVVSKVMEEKMLNAGWSPQVLDSSIMGVLHTSLVD